jgi:hypothetical protein
MSSKISSTNDMYQQVVSHSLSVETVFSAISDNKSLLLFNIIGIMSSHALDEQPTGEILISRMNLTRRQYYTRINQLRDAGLITRKSTKFALTSLGRVVYETQRTIGAAIQNRWRLQAIDSLENTLNTHGSLLKKDTNLSIRYLEIVIISEKYFCPLSCQINEYVLVHRLIGITT